jgi:hypothetical protein
MVNEINDRRISQTCSREFAVAGNATTTAQSWKTTLEAEYWRNVVQIHLNTPTRKMAWLGRTQSEEVGWRNGDWRPSTVEKRMNVISKDRQRR